MTFGYNMNRQDFVNLINQNDYRAGVEIGVHRGLFSNHLLKNSHLEVLYSVDCWATNKENQDPNGTYQYCTKLLSQYGERSKIIKEYSVPASLKFPDDSLDFIYIDAPHDYYSVITDINVWFPKLRSGGILAGHDYHSDWPGVIDAVNEFFNSHKRYILNITEYGEVDDDGTTSVRNDKPSWWTYIRKD